MGPGGGDQQPRGIQLRGYLCLHLWVAGQQVEGPGGGVARGFKPCGSIEAGGGGGVGVGGGTGAGR